MVHARQRLRVGVAALALLLQAMSPLWAAWIAFAAEPQSEAVVCTAHEHENEAPHQQRAPAHGHLIACPLCMIVSHAFYAPVGSSLRIAFPTRVVIVRHERFQAAAPRGPPAFEPNARAPPVIL